MYLVGTCPVSDTLSPLESYLALTANDSRARVDPLKRLATSEQGAHPMARVATSEEGVYPCRSRDCCVPSGLTVRGPCGGSGAGSLPSSRSGSRCREGLTPSLRS